MLAGSSATALHVAGRGGGHRKLSWRYARASDIDRFYGKRPAATLRAVVVCMDGEPMGIVGVARDPNCNKYFSDYKPELEPYLKTITVLRAIKASMEIVKQTPGVYAEAKHEEGERVLQRLGFKPHGSGFAWVT